ncbi:hypothetical protein BAU15_07505 [Enterococcus sp. JM4C]|uniref:DUF7006 family protein n=1 Tax=Candidatus Enterococcus huntleyi TaxID=1857217 RepID=UPI00137A4E03|nr:hypothetical protein [Enterococcus sp. JM4C]KAF1297549.1 hypothetical protein BAU15_07505 [Enterococcus sp. JM4C]
MNHSEYITHFRSICEEEEFREKYPTIAGRMEEICQLIQTVVQEISEDNAFLSIGKLQGYDAQLQILLELKDELLEEQVVRIAENDCKTFAKEQFGYNQNEEAPVSLYMLAQ